jgi:hypothetical protein
MSSKQSTTQTPKTIQFLECLVPNLIGLYLNGYLGVVLSFALLFWQWYAEKNNPTPRRKILLGMVGAIALSWYFNPNLAIAPPPALFNAQETTAIAPTPGN